MRIVIELQTKQTVSISVLDDATKRPSDGVMSTKTLRDAETKIEKTLTFPQRQ